MNAGGLHIVVLGLSLSSSWGNGHATTYRSLIRGLRAIGQRVSFLERNTPWYEAHRDLPAPDFCDLAFYEDVEELRSRYGNLIATSDAVIVGSFVPDGVNVIDLVAQLRPKRFCYYDIDTPVTLARLAGRDAGAEQYVALRQLPLFDICFSFTGGPTLRHLEELGAARVVELYCSVDPSRYRNTAEPIQWDLGYLGTYSDDRQEKLESLLLNVARAMPNRLFVVAGSRYPPGIKWPPNVDRIEHLPPEKHASFYSRQRFTLNITRQDMVQAGWSPSVRIFEAAACETPIISDYWHGLDELLPIGVAVIVARSTADVVAALDSVSERERASIAAEAGARVMRGHTAERRARQLLDDLLSIEPRSAGQVRTGGPNAANPVATAW
ncbi:glycosyltransferase [Mesorhizobium sp. KR2-14]|uniref:CgeB family protein n=1 Tax=Mesorhizobium sp. KR2-14 TaxID=3156610 RepID=UPI0032B5E140